MCDDTLTTCTCGGLLPANNYTFRLTTIKTGFDDVGSDLYYAATGV